MIREQRIELIRQELKGRGIVSVAELTKTLASSRSTIRRDLFELEEQKELKCIRGGAVAQGKQAAYEPSFEMRQDLFVEEKRRIAERALEFICENSTVLLDSGTTTYELAKLLTCRKHMYIATNDLKSAMSLSVNPDISVIVLGGSIRTSHYSMNGFFTEEMIQQIHADTTFLSVDAVDLDAGLMGFSMEEIASKRLMIRSSQRTIVLCDHSKFDSVAFVNICPLREIDGIITGKEIDPAVLSKLEEQGIMVLTV